MGKYVKYRERKGDAINLLLYKILGDHQKQLWMILLKWREEELQSNKYCTVQLKTLQTVSVDIQVHTDM